MVKDLIVQGEVIAGDDIDTSILLDLPVGETKTLGLGEEVSLGELTTPVFLACQLAVLPKLYRPSGRQCVPN